MVFKRKIYDDLLKWKNQSNGKVALLVEGARRVGKSTIIEEFAKNEYKSYIMIDFSNTKESFTKDVKDVFEKSKDYNEFFQMLQIVIGTKLYERKSLIVFDEVQKYIKAREMIKFLVKDGRYDYIETGSLISLKKNSRKILIPSEERKIEMFPMCFEEFLIALGEEQLLENIKNSYKERKPLFEPIHKKAMNLFRTYMAVGGMPKVVSEYIKTNDYEKVDLEKRDIIKLYREDLLKISRKKSSVTPLIIYDRIQSMFSNHSFEILPASFSKNTKLFTCLNNVDDLESSKVVNVAYEIKNIDATLSLGYDLSGVKVYSGDTGLLVTKMFYDKEFLDNSLYKSIILDKLSVDEGFLYENVVAQELRANKHSLKYNTFYKENSNNIYSIDFFVEKNKKFSPIEVKSSNYNSHASLDEFYNRYHQYIDKKIIIYSKGYKEENNIIYLPVYMTMCI